MLALLTLVAAAQDPAALVRAEHLPAIAHGGERLVPVVVEVAHGWHIYWENPGDSGMATELWTAEGPVAVRYPVPERIELPGDIVNYGYHGRVVLYAAGPAAGPLDVDFLVCREVCIRGRVRSTEAAPERAMDGLHQTSLLPVPLLVTATTGGFVVHTTEVCTLAPKAALEGQLPPDFPGRFDAGALHFPVRATAEPLEGVLRCGTSLVRGYSFVIPPKEQTR